MATETKIMNVKNEDVQSTIEFCDKFMWKLKSRCLKQFDSAAKTTDYTRLVFERDKEMPNYGRITKLEQQYRDVSEELPDRRFDSFKSFAQYFSNDYRTGGQKAAMIIIRAVLLIAALFVLSQKMLFAVCFVVFALTFIISNGMKEKAFEDNLSDSKSRVCEAYRKYKDNLLSIDAINNELCTLRDVSLEIKYSA